MNYNVLFEEKKKLCRFLLFLINRGILAKEVKAGPSHHTHQTKPFLLNFVLTVCQKPHFLIKLWHALDVIKHKFERLQIDSILCSSMSSFVASSESHPYCCTADSSSSPICRASGNSTLAANILVCLDPFCCFLLSCTYFLLVYGKQKGYLSITYSKLTLYFLLEHPIKEASLLGNQDRTGTQSCRLYCCLYSFFSRDLCLERLLSFLFLNKQNKTYFNHLWQSKHHIKAISWITTN